MKLVFVPKTKFGKWSLWFSGVFFVSFALTQIVAAIGRSQGAFDVPDRSNIYMFLIPVAIIPAGLSAIAAFILGLVSIIKFKERSWLVYGVSLIGLLVLWFVIGEVVIPH